MSVSYILNKGIRVKDLKDNGLIVEEGTHYPLTIESRIYVLDANQGSWVGVTDYIINEEGEILITELEGHTGFGVMWEIYQKLDVKFITDEELDSLIREAEIQGTDTIELTDEVFNKYIESKIKDGVKVYSKQELNEVTQKCL